MSPGVFMFLAFAVFVALNLPVAVAIGVSSLLTIIIFEVAPFQVIPQIISASIDSFSLLAIPLFIMFGTIVGKTGMARRLVSLASILLGDLPGGVAIVTIVTGAILGAMSGSNVASVAALFFLVGAMEELGYPRRFGVAVIAAGCTFGVIIPPSINMIIYGVITETSIPKLFAAGVFPGILLMVTLSTYIYFRSRKEGWRGMKVERTPLNVLKAFKDAIWGLAAPVVILGGIYGGIFTATEAAAVAVGYVILVDIFIYRELHLTDYWDMLMSSARSTGTVMLLMVFASLFAWLMLTQGVAFAARDFILDISGGNKIFVLLLINLGFIIIGMFIDPVSAIYILVPLFFPLTKAIGVDPIHFGAIMTVNLSMAHLTPPVGLALYLAANIAKVPFQEAIREAVPFIICEIVVILLTTFVPALSMWLPSFIR
ncbi:MAG: TRAP transporter large permease [Syntrophales bacterium]|nr:TRAP transporter large permease [Syntrophales bacterium]